MKRCPQCEFIYEDDQSLCDMDGVLLVFDSRTLPNLHALTTVSAKTPPKRKRTVPAFATLILALVLGMVYYISTPLNTAQSTESPATPASSIPAVNLPSETQPPTPEALAPSVATKDEPKPAATKPSTPASTLASVKKPTAKTTSTSQTKPAPEVKKEDSKVGSILKKTGRILKKPFKF
jgi:cytoskeletal protein RodZ